MFERMDRAHEVVVIEASSSLGELVIGIAMAIFGVTMIPFATELWRDWLSASRARRERAIRVYEEVVSGQNRAPSFVGESDIARANRQEQHAAMRSAQVLKFYSMFSERDLVVKQAAKEWVLSDSETEKTIMQTWAYGGKRKARRMSRQLLKRRSSQQPES